MIAQIIRNTEVVVIENGQHPFIQSSGGYTAPLTGVMRENYLDPDVDPTLVTDELSNVNLFTINGSIHEWKPEAKTSYLDSEETFDIKMDVLGIDNKNLPQLLSNDVKVTNVQAIGEGATLSTTPITIWSPFKERLNTTYEIERLVCSNGMTVKSKHFETQVKIENEWEKHIEVAQKASHATLLANMERLIKRMNDAPTSVHTMGLVKSLLGTAINAGGDEEGLIKFQEMVDPRKHLDKVYKPETFKVRDIGETAKSHMTRWSVYNLLTEASTHMMGNAASDQDLINKFNMMASKLMFDYSATDQLMSLEKVTKIVDIDPNQIFLG